MGQEEPAQALADSYPEQWRRTALIPGLRQRVREHLQTHPDQTEHVDALGQLLGHGRPMTDEEWRAWAAGAFAQVVADEPSDS